MMTHVVSLIRTRRRIIRGPMHRIILFWDGGDEWAPDVLTGCGLTLPGQQVVTSRGYRDPIYGPSACGDCFA